MPAASPLAAVFGLFLSLLGIGNARAADMSLPPAASAYDFTLTAIDGTPMPLAAYRGKVLLIVNVASRCGFTGQYAGLEKLYETYKDRGLVIIGVPSNDFGAQEPGTEAEIQKFAADNYKATFPLTHKSVVSGAGADPFYQWAAAQNVGNILNSAPRWNFHKYLIDRNGHLVGSYTPLTAPDSETLKIDLERALDTAPVSAAQP